MRVNRDAEPDTIVVSAAVHELVNGGVKATDLGARSLKGFVDSVPLYEVAWH